MDGPTIVIFGILSTVIEIDLLRTPKILETTPGSDDFDMILGKVKT